METYWRSNYSQFPKFTCPRCSKGKLHLKASSLEAIEPAHSQREHSDEAWEPDWIRERFTCFLVCDGVCGEVVVVSGLRTHSYNVDYDDETGEEVVFEGQYHHPKLFYPALKIISVSKKLNKQCGEDLTSSFALLWVDPAACANRIRTFIEHLLDQFGIERLGINKHGEEYKLNLMQRLEKLEAVKPDHKATLSALKKVGDFASHQGKAKFDTLIKCYELLEYALADLVDGKKDRMKKLTAELLDGDDL